MPRAEPLPPHDDETAIDVVCPAPSHVSPVQLDRFLFSLVLQSYRALHVTVVVDKEAVGDGERAAGKFDWSGFPRPPIFVVQPDGPQDERSRRAFAIAQATRRFVGVVDVRGTLYTRAFELLMEGMRQSRAAVVFGDAIVKDMRTFPTFTYETKRHYLGAWSSGVLQLRAGWLPPLAACLLDRDRIARADFLDRNSNDEAIVFRLLSRYPARPIEERVPLYARERSVEVGDTARRQLRRGATDRFVLAFRDLRRKMTR